MKTVNGVLHQTRVGPFPFPFGGSLWCDLPVDDEDPTVPVYGVGVSVPVGTVVRGDVTASPQGWGCLVELYIFILKWWRMKDVPPYNDPRL